MTRPPTPAFVPPAPYPPQPYPTDPPTPNEVWYGTDALWTMLPENGVWGATGLPYSDGFYWMKLLWFHYGYDWQKEPNPPLTITGRRLDGPALPLTADVSNAYNDEFKSHMVGGGGHSGTGLLGDHGRL